MVSASSLEGCCRRHWHPWLIQPHRSIQMTTQTLVSEFKKILTYSISMQLQTAYMLSSDSPFCHSYKRPYSRQVDVMLSEIVQKELIKCIMIQHHRYVNSGKAQIIRYWLVYTVNPDRNLSGTVNQPTNPPGKCAKVRQSIFFADLCHSPDMDRH